MQPETGDELQWEKAGQLEIADIVVVHKADLPSAERVESAAPRAAQSARLPAGPGRARQLEQGARGRRALGGRYPRPIELVISTTQATKAST